MLNYFLENDLVRIHDTAPRRWEEAIKLSAQNLIDKKIVTEDYSQRIIANIKEHGAYIVILPGVALPHAANNDAVLGTAISFDKMKEPVFFENGNPQKSAQLFFTFASLSSEEHSRNISNLADMLMKDGLIDALNAIENIGDYRNVVRSFEAAPSPKPKL